MRRTVLLAGVTGNHVVVFDGDDSRVMTPYQALEYADRLALNEETAQTADQITTLAAIANSYRLQ